MGVGAARCLLHPGLFDRRTGRGRARLEHDLFDHALLDRE
jgi:hypothetical protein